MFESLNRNEKPSVTPEDIEAAIELIKERPELRDNPRVKALVEREFVTEDGRQLDPGEFLSKMLDHLESMDNEPEPLTPAERMKKIEDAMVVYAKPTND